nr:hypothetical protein [Planctomycetota bacterium]
MIAPAMNDERLSLHLVVRGLCLVEGLSALEVASRAGISPGAVASWSGRVPEPFVTWSRLVAALGGEVVIERRGRAWRVALAKPGALRIARAWEAWRHRRRTVTAIQLRHAGRPRAEIADKADSYASNEERRLRERMSGIRAGLTSLTGSLRADGLRAALRTLAVTAGVTAEELALLAGCSLNGAQLAMADHDEGRLATLHRLLTAADARLRIVLPRGRIDVAACAPGD